METMPPALVEAMRVKEPSAERENRVEVEGSKEALTEELLKKSRPAKAPARPTVPMRSKSTRGKSARATLRIVRRRTRHQGYVVIVELCGLTYGGERERIKKKGKERRGCGVGVMRGRCTAVARRLSPTVLLARWRFNKRTFGRENSLATTSFPSHTRHCLIRSVTNTFRHHRG